MSVQSFKVIKLYFKSSLHLSKGKNGSYESSEGVLHSDTLKSALYVSLRQLYSDEALFKTFMDNVVLSSAFPFVDKGDTAGYWLPRPLTYRHPEEKEKPELRKEYKKVNHVTISQMAQILRGEHPTDLLKEGKAHQPNIWKRDTTQRVKINYDDDSEPFYLEKMYPHDKAHSGLYFIIQDNGFDTSKLKAALKLLGDNGIGLQRGLGNGQFSFNEDSFEMDMPQGQSWISLSLFRPQKEDIVPVLDKSNYQFIKRGGWISSPEDEQFLSIRKKSIMMFTEGSVFAFGEKPVSGIVENIRPVWNDDDLHPIYRDGKAIFLPMVAQAT
jgi:CRISPR-associated protein Csm4